METARTVFVVDDDRSCREAICAVAETLGATVLPFASGEEFLAQCTADQAGCVVLDVRMPGLTGHEVYDAMQARDLTQPVVMVTGHGDIPMAVRAIQRGVFAFFEKPCRGQDLWECLRSALAYDERLRTETVRVKTIRDRLNALTEDERQVMEMMLRNVPSKTIAKRLGISIRTVQVRRTAVFDRMRADSIAALATMIEMLRAHEAADALRLRQPAPPASLSPPVALAHSF